MIAVVNNEFQVTADQQKSLLQEERNARKKWEASRHAPPINARHRSYCITLLMIVCVTYGLAAKYLSYVIIIYMSSITAVTI